MGTTENTGPALLGDHVAWDGDHLALTSEKALHVVRRTSLSVSTSQAVASCPARMVGEKLLPQRVDPFGPNTLGTGAHSVLEILYGLEPAERTKLALARVVREVTATFATDNPGLLTTTDEKSLWAQEVAHRAMGIFELEDPTDIVIGANERKIDGVDVGGVPFIGYIDRTDDIVFRGKPGARVTDYKGGNAKEAGPDRFGNDPHGDQLRIYAEAVRVVDGTKPVAAQVLYIAHRKRVRVPLGPKAMKPTLARFADAWNDLQRFDREEVVPTATSGLCGWCPLVNSCPAANAADHGPSDRAPAAPSAVLLGIPVLRPAAAGPAHELVPALAPALHADDWDEPSGAEDTDMSHQRGNGSNTETEEQSMSTNQSPWRETKPWEGVTVDGHLSMASYAATAVFGVTELAVESLHGAGQQISPKAVKALTHVLASVVLDAQEAITHSRDWQDGANTRMRGALRTVLETVPLPFGRDEDAWSDWQTRATRRCVSIAQVALDLFDTGPRDGAIRVIATTTTDGALRNAG